MNVPQEGATRPDVYDRAQVERLLPEACSLAHAGLVGRPPSEWNYLHRHTPVLSGCSTRVLRGAGAQDALKARLANGYDDWG